MMVGIFGLILMVIAAFAGLTSIMIAGCTFLICEELSLITKAIKDKK